MNIQRRDLITNGFFSRDEKRIQEVVDMLAESGVGNVALSVDAFHQERIPLDPVRYFAECVRKTDMMLRTISFSPNGDVLNGNIGENSIIDVIAAYSAD